MRIIHDRKGWQKNRFTAIALGNFDGLHLAHMEIVNTAIVYAKQHNMDSMVYTFETHPMNLMHPDMLPGLVMTTEQKEAVLQKTDLSILYLESFTSSFMKKTPEEFVRMLKDQFQSAFISVGYNYRFGYQGKGDVAKLQELCDYYHIALQVAKPMYWEHNLISSSRIRSCIAEGDMPAATAMLGRPYFVTGFVEHGREIGRKMGFPTVNTPVEKGAVIPKFGVYNTHTFIDDRWYKSVTNVGIKPTVGSDCVTIETFIIDFHGNVYGKNVQVDFLQWTRGEKKFDSIEELQQQISRDVDRSCCYIYRGEEECYV